MYRPQDLEENESHIFLVLFSMPHGKVTQHFQVNWPMAVCQEELCKAFIAALYAIKIPPP